MHACAGDEIAKELFLRDKCSHVGFDLSVCLKQLSQMVDFTSDDQRSRCSFLPPQAELQRRTVSLSTDNAASHLH